MPPSFLIAGATGNTGRSVVKTLSSLLKHNDAFATYQILALTRDSRSVVAQQLAELPSVQVVQQNWVDVSSDWLREREVS